jgi:hypothetical protein
LAEAQAQAPPRLDIDCIACKSQLYLKTVWPPMGWLEIVIELVLIFTLGPFCWVLLGVVFGAMAERLLYRVLGREPADSIYHVTNGLAAVATLGLVLWLT